MSGIKVITFDLDNTLWDVDPIIVRAERLMREWLYAQVPQVQSVYESPTLGELRHEAINTRPELKHDVSSLRRELLYQLILRSDTSSAIDNTYALAIANEAFERFLSARHDVEYYEDALDVLSALSQCYTLGALTNGNADYRRLNLDRYFSFGYCAADVGMSKPGPEVFRSALAHTKVSADAVVHVGDHLIDDVHGANCVGMNSIWVNFDRSDITEHLKQSEHEVTPNAVVHALKDLPEAIEHLVGRCGTPTARPPTP